MKTPKLLQLAALLLSTLGFEPSAALAQGTAFTYQGRLNDGANPANGTYDLQFAIYDAPTGGTQQGAGVTNSFTAVSNGLFTVTLDFGNQFPGANRWLEIGVRTNGNEVFAALAPRQPLTPAPYAIFAGGANASGLSGIIPASAVGGTYGNVMSLNNGANSFNGTFSGSGSGLLDVWHTGGNAGTTAGVNYLGTTDYQPLELRVNGARALRLEPTVGATEVNVIGGSVGNLVTSGAVGATVWGGGFDGTNNNGNTVSGNYGTVSGGRQNSANNAETTVAGGRANTANGFNSTVSGGYANTASGAYASIAGGEFNLVTNADYAVIGGGLQNTVQTNAGFATIGGGKFNQATVNEATVAGGAFNSALAFSATIGGGGGNVVSGEWATIGGGRANLLTASDYATIGGGVANTIQSNSYNALIAGGHDNTIESSAHSAISGGGYNTIQLNAYDSVIGGGGYNTIQTNAHSSFIGSGGGNTIQADASYSTIGGGLQNTIETNSSLSIIGGGYQNTIQPSAYYSTISGGIENTIQTNSYYSAIGGGGGNNIQPSAIGSTIGGGVYNASAGLYSTVGGGLQNTNSSVYGTLAGGYLNTAGGGLSTTVGGGEQNTSSGSRATVPGGLLNAATGDYSFAAGRQAKANHTSAFVWADSSVVADFLSTADNQFLIRAGGGVGINKNNPATALDVAGTITATAFSGSGAGLASLSAASLTGTITDARLSANVALLNAGQTFTGLNVFNNANNSFTGAFTGTGSGLTALNASQLTSGSVPAAALGNAWQISGNGGTTPGTHFLGTTDNQGLELKVNGARALRLEPNLTSPNLVGGSPANVVTNGYYGAVIGGGGAVGAPNRVGAYYASVLGGSGNTASGNYSVAMGLNTTARGLYSTAMGRLTVAANDDATAMGLGCSALGWDTVAMGTFSVAGGHYSLAAGYYATATNQSAFVWSDSSAIPGANSLADNSVTMRASGGYRLFSNSGSTLGVSLAANGTAWATISDRNVKKDFAAVDSVAILEKLAAMPITQWHYKWEESSITPHIGPMAQDFKAAFYPGTDDKSITTQEADGVALAAIQGLNHKLSEQEAALKNKDAEIHELRQAVAELQKAVRKITNPEQEQP